MYKKEIKLKVGVVLIGFVSKSKIITEQDPNPPYKFNVKSSKTEFARNQQFRKNTTNPINKIQ